MVHPVQRAREKLGLTGLVGDQAKLLAQLEKAETENRLSPEQKERLDYLRRAQETDKTSSNH